jgi:hypothetical protein
MDEAVCRKCGGKFPKSEVFSWGICKDCDKAKGAEVRKLKYRRQIFGTLSLFALFGFATLLISFIAGPNENGYYTLVSKYREPNRVTYNFLWWMTVSDIVLFSLSLFGYIVYRVRTEQTEREWTDTSSRT